MARIARELNSRMYTIVTFLQIRSFDTHIAPPKVLSVKKLFLHIRSFDSGIAPSKVLSVKKSFFTDKIFTDKTFYI